MSQSTIRVIITDATGMVGEGVAHVCMQRPEVSACFFCLGVSSVGMNAEQYFQTTYTLTMQVGEALSKSNPDMSFCYISGAGEDTQLL